MSRNGNLRRKRGIAAALAAALVACAVAGVVVALPQVGVPLPDAVLSADDRGAASCDSVVGADPVSGVQAEGALPAGDAEYTPLNGAATAGDRVYPDHEPGVALVSPAPGTSASDLVRSLEDLDCVSAVVSSPDDASAGFVKVELAEGADEQQALETIEQMPEAASSQPDYYYYLDDFYEVGNELNIGVVEDVTASVSSMIEAAISNDPKVGSQWALGAVKAASAWSQLKTAGVNDLSVTVAVLDSGFVISHPDLKKAVVGSRGISHAIGWNDGTNSRYHGTMVSGVIAATVNNKVGVAGVGGNKVGVLPIEVGAGNGRISTSAAAQGYDFIVRNAKAYNIRVVNMSFGAYGTDVLLESWADKARSKGIMSVAASGNDNRTARSCPSDGLPATKSGFSVIATTSAGDRASFSNYNASGSRAKELSAPGKSVLTTTGSSSYASVDGTSFASPYVAGVAALVFAAQPGLSVAQARDILTSTATDVYFKNSKFYRVGFDEQTGYGIVNASAAVKKALSYGKGGTSIAAAKLSGIVAKRYTGVAQAQDGLVVTLGGKRLVEGEDYTTSYRSNVNIGTAKLTVTGMGDYTGKIEASFEISPASVASAYVTSSASSASPWWYPYDTRDDYFGDAIRALSGETTSSWHQVLYEKDVELAPAGHINDEVYDGTAKKPKPRVVVGNTMLGAREWNIEKATFLYGSGDYQLGWFQLVEACPWIGDHVEYLNGLSWKDEAALESERKANRDLDDAFRTVGSTFTSYLYNKDTVDKPYGLLQYTVARYLTYMREPDYADGEYFAEGVTLREGVDYTLSYRNNVEAGTATIVITGKAPNCTGTKEATFKIAPCNIDSGSVSITGLTSKVCTGEPIEQKPTVKRKVGKVTTKLVEGKDYELAYEDNVDVGTATVVVSGIGNYTLWAERTFKITPAKLKASMIGDIDEQLYTGWGITPQPDVSFASSWLEEGVDYTLSYKNNVNVGKATVTVTGTGTGAVKGSASKTFAIVADLGNAEVSVAKTATYTSKEVKPKPTVKLGTKTLKAGTDYTLSYDNNIDVGTATVYVEGIGSYGGMAQAQFEITPLSIGKASVGGVKTKAYTGSAIDQEIVVKYAKQEIYDYNVEYFGNLEAGTAVMAICGRDNFCGTTTRSFTVKATKESEKLRDIAKAKVSGISTLALDGGSMEQQALKLTYGKAVLEEGTDYDVTYFDNDAVGTATMVIQGIGDYAGAVAKTFKVTKAKPAVAKISQAQVAPLDDEQFTGYTVTPEPEVKMGDVVLVEGEDYKLSYSNNVMPGTATVTITGISPYTGSKKVTFRIAADLSDAVLLGLGDQVYDGKAKTPLKSVTLNGKVLKKGADYEVEYKDNVNAGTATATVKGKGGYDGSASDTFEIAKAANPMKAKSANKTVNYSRLALVDVAVPGAIAVPGAKGRLTYEWISGNKRLSLNPSTGVVTVLKGSPRGSYSARVAVTAEGDDNHEPLTTTVTLTILVK